MTGRRVSSVVQAMVRVAKHARTGGADKAHDMMRVVDSSFGAAVIALVSVAPGENLSGALPRLYLERAVQLRDIGNVQHELHDRRALSVAVPAVVQIVTFRDDRLRY